MSVLMTNKVRPSAQSFFTFTTLLYGLLGSGAQLEHTFDKKYPPLAVLLLHFCGVNSLVLIKLGALAKDFSTFSALVWFFSGVNSDV